MWLCVVVLLWGSAFCSIRCPDETLCSDLETCCQTDHGYRCCPYPQAVCCPDRAHCCPPGYECNLVKQTCVKPFQPWITIPIVKKVAGKVSGSPDRSLTPFQEVKHNNIPEQSKSSVVHCDNMYTCPDGTTCCAHLKGGWFCCPNSPAKCCLDGFHCCPYGYDCDNTYTHCVRDGLEYLLTNKQSHTSVPASLISVPEYRGSKKEKPLTALTEASVDNSFNQGVIRCDNEFYCPNGSSCCKGPKDNWNCCPFQLGTCCADGRHCCEYGYKCDPSSSKCI